MIDYHIHTSLSADCDIDMMRMAAAAQQKGLKEICFTDHHDFDFPCGVDCTVDFKLYAKQYQEVKAAYPQINIRKGIEAGLEPHNFHRFADLLRDEELDYIVGSVHVINGYDPYFEEFWQKNTKQEAFDEYARLSLECVRAADFYDVFGHLGYISKYCPFEDNLFIYSDYKDVVDEILKILIERGQGLEVNTSGLIKTGNLLPDLPIIQRFKQLGGEIVTVGSDAHTNDLVGYAADYTLDALKTLGFKYVCAFDKREARFLPLP
jgi:histidinol-phosphatase (PHP family)